MWWAALGVLGEPFPSGIGGAHCSGAPWEPHLLPCGGTIFFCSPQLKILSLALSESVSVLVSERLPLNPGLSGALRS